MHRDDLLRAVRSDPDADGPLVAYADALAAAGDPLAEFIRVQRALAIGDVDADERAELVLRERALLAAHEEAWLGPLRDVVDDHTWWRGLLGLDVTVAAFLRRHADLVASPAVRFIDVSDWSANLESGAWQAFTACPDLRHVTMLGVRGRYLYDEDAALLHDADAALLATSAHAAGLISLDLGFNAIGDAGLAALARSPHLTGLTALALRGCRYGVAGLRALAEEGTCVRLTTLDLSYCEGPPTEDRSAGWRALSATRRFPELRHVRLAGNAISEDVLAAFAGRTDAVDESW